MNYLLFTCLLSKLSTELKLWVVMILSLCITTSAYAGLKNECVLEMFNKHGELLENAGSITVNVIRQDAIGEFLNVDFFSDESVLSSVNIATIGIDFESSTGTLTWLANEEGAKTIVNILDDNEEEDSGSFNVLIADPAGCSFDGSTEAIITILDDDKVAGSVPESPVLLPLERQGSYVLVRWEDRSDNETAFEVERESWGKFGGGHWSKTIRITVDENQTGLLDPVSKRKYYRYRVRAVKNQSASLWSEWKEIDRLSFRKLFKKTRMYVNLSFDLPTD